MTTVKSFVSKNRSFFSRLFPRGDIYNYVSSELIDKAIRIAEKKNLKKELSKILEREVKTISSIWDFFNIITPLLIQFAIINEFKGLFNSIILKMCEYGFYSAFDLSKKDQDYILRHLIYRCGNLKIEQFLEFDIDIRRKVFKELSDQLIGKKILTECTYDNLDSNLYSLYHSIHEFYPVNNKKTEVALKTMTDKSVWLPRITHDPKKLNLFYESAIPKNVITQIFSIYDKNTRMRWIKKIRTVQSALRAKKELHLKKRLDEEYFK